jgi:hypothetical protein
MTYCRRCRVVIQDETSQHCPLCTQPLIHPEGNERPEDIFLHWRSLNKAHQHPSFWYSPQSLSGQKVIHFILDFLMLALLSSILILATVNLYQINRFGMSSFPLYLPTVSLFYAILLLASLRFYHLSLGGQWLILVNTALFFIGLDLRDSAMTWAFSRGAVLVFGGFAPFIFLQMLWKVVKVKGLNMIGFMLFGLSISLISLDAGISGGKLQGWSLFSFTSLLFVALVFLYLHYVAKVRINFAPILHVKRTQKDETHAR